MHCAAAGEEFSADNPQPNNPQYDNWWATLVCPWNLNICGAEPLGANGEEHLGVPIEWSEAQNENYQGEDRRTMSCGLCGFLVRTLGPPPFQRELAAVNELGREAAYGNNWDMHPFGAWLANEQARQGWSLEETVHDINMYRASNGEEIHGFLWQSLRLLAQNSDGSRRANLELEEGPRYMRRVCAPTWGLSAQSRDDCAHAAGHGLFYFCLDIGLAVKGCWSDEMLRDAPGWVAAKDLLRWRWLCA